MRVKCVDNKGNYSGYTLCLTPNKEYEALELEGNTVLITDDSGAKLWYHLERFELIKEDKMEEVRIVRKLEDLDGLENGMGLKIEVEDDKFKIIYKQSGDLIRSLIIAECHVPIIKSMGFNFDYVPARSLVEIYKEMGENSLCGYKKWSYGITLKDNGIYEICNSNYFLGQFIFEKEQAQKYADELNEIIGVGK